MNLIEKMTGCILTVLSVKSDVIIVLNFDEDQSTNVILVAAIPINWTERSFQAFKCSNFKLTLTIPQVSAHN